ncbi:MAG: MarR family transcriptional regulator [Micrococcaceae bacterium]
MDKVSMVAILNQQLQELSEETILFHEAVANALGIHITDHKCLTILGRTGPLPISELAKRLGLSKSAATFMADRLEKKHMVQRIASSTDRRKILIKPIPSPTSGQLKECFQTLDQEMQKELNSYSLEELELILHFVEATKSALIKSWIGTKQI